MCDAIRSGRVALVRFEPHMRPTSQNRSASANQCGEVRVASRLGHRALAQAGLDGGAIAWQTVK